MKLKFAYSKLIDEFTVKIFIVELLGLMKAF